MPVKRTEYVTRTLESGPLTLSFAPGHTYMLLTIEGYEVNVPIPRNLVDSLIEMLEASKDIPL